MATIDLDLAMPLSPSEEAYCDEYSQRAPLYVIGDQAPRSIKTSSSFEPPAFMDTDWDEEVPEIAPTMLQVEGGGCLLYAGHSHSIAGRGGSGKTWLAVKATISAVRSGLTAVYVDYEDTRTTFRSRLKAMGCTRAEAQRIAHWRVGFSLLQQTQSGKAWLAWCDEHRPRFVTLDSVAKACGAAGLNDEINPEFIRWWNGFGVPLENRGITLLVIDHVGHGAPGSKGGDRERGASAKRDAMSGASFLFRTTKHWTKSNSGRAELTVLKCRHGDYETDDTVAHVIVTVESNGTRLTMSLVAPTSEDGTISKPGRRSWYMEQVSYHLKLDGIWHTQSDIESAVGKSPAYTRAALPYLVDEGFVAHELRGNAKMYRHIRSYFQVDDPKSDKFDPATPF